MDDVRLGRAVRALRRRRGWRQADLAGRVGCSQQRISTLERGQAAGMSIASIRAMARALDASVELDLRWRGGALDRLLDARHVELGAVVVAMLERAVWSAWPEVTYSVYGERGSIDIAAWHPAGSVLLVVDLKSELGSVEATLRKHDEKVRLAPTVLRDRVGTAAGGVSRLLVLPDSRTAAGRSSAADSCSSAPTRFGAGRCRAGSCGRTAWSADCSSRLFPALRGAALRSSRQILAWMVRVTGAPAHEADARAARARGPACCCQILPVVVRNRRRPSPHHGHAYLAVIGVPAAAPTRWTSTCQRRTSPG
jgi:transcriptional regulator with XRE-family HTH domain